MHIKSCILELVYDYTCVIIFLATMVPESHPIQRLSGQITTVVDRLAGYEECKVLSNEQDDALNVTNPQPK